MIEFLLLQCPLSLSKERLYSNWSIQIQLFIQLINLILFHLIQELYFILDLEQTSIYKRAGPLAALIASFGTADSFPGTVSFLIYFPSISPTPYYIAKASYRVDSPTPDMAYASLFLLILMEHNTRISNYTLWTNPNQLNPESKLGTPSCLFNSNINSISDLSHPPCSITWECT